MLLKSVATIDFVPDFKKPLELVLQHLLSVTSEEKLR